MIEAIAAAGPEAGSALPLLRRALRGDEAASALTALGRIGAHARTSRGDVMVTVRRYPRLMPIALDTIEATGMTIGPSDWSLLYRTYARGCRDAGAIAFFSFSRDDACDELADRMERLAVRTGRRFQEVGN